MKKTIPAAHVSLALLRERSARVGLLRLVPLHPKSYKEEKHMSNWIKKGDKIVVITGNDRGKTGDVIRRKGDRVVVQGINIRKKHAKRQKKAPGTEILEME